MHICRDTNSHARKYECRGVHTPSVGQKFSLYFGAVTDTEVQKVTEQLRCFTRDSFTFSAFFSLHVSYNMFLCALLSGCLTVGTVCLWTPFVFVSEFFLRSISASHSSFPSCLFCLDFSCSAERQGDWRSIEEENSHAHETTQIHTYTPLKLLSSGISFIHILRTDTNPS